ncbi:MAG: hypothetical protein RJQ07_04305 [Pseudomonadales bacterium]
MSNAEIVNDEHLMTIDMIYDALYSALSLSDASFQIWMSFSFAVIVAAHFAGHRIKRYTYPLVAGLYGLYSVILIIRYSSAAYQIIHFQNLLTQRGFEPWPVPNPIGFTIGTGTFLLMVGGTVATLWFVRKVAKEHTEVAA